MNYELWTCLPLLQGISSTDFLHWEEALRLDIDELPASRLPLIRHGDNCSQLLWLVEGELLREQASPIPSNGGVNDEVGVGEERFYTTRSTLKAPAVIELDRLFGLTPTYEYTYRAKTDVKMLGIRKSAIGSHLMKSEVFRLNLLNTLCACAQKRAIALLPSRQDNAEARLQHFLRNLFRDCEGEVELVIKMKELAHFVGERRLVVSQLLNRWADEGLITLGRGHFTIHDIGAFTS